MASIPGLDWLCYHPLILETVSTSPHMTKIVSLHFPQKQSMFILHQANCLPQLTRGLAAQKLCPGDGHATNHVHSHRRFDWMLAKPAFKNCLGRRAVKRKGQTSHADCQSVGHTRIGREGGWGLGDGRALMAGLGLLLLPGAALGRKAAAAGAVLLRRVDLSSLSALVVYQMFL